MVDVIVETDTTVRAWLAAPPDRHDQRVGDDLVHIVSLIDQPTTRRENRSITAAAYSQRFFSSLKSERIARKTYRTRNQARKDVFDYIERF